MLAGMESYTFRIRKQWIKCWIFILKPVFANRFLLFANFSSFPTIIDVIVREWGDLWNSLLLGLDFLSHGTSTHREQNLGGESHAACILLAISVA